MEIQHVQRVRQEHIIQEPRILHVLLVKKVIIVQVELTTLNVLLEDIIQVLMENNYLIAQFVDLEHIRI